MVAAFPHKQVGNSPKGLKDGKVSALQHDNAETFPTALAFPHQLKSNTQRLTRKQPSLPAGPPQPAPPFVPALHMQPQHMPNLTEPSMHVTKLSKSARCTLLLGSGHMAEKESPTCGAASSHPNLNSHFPAKTRA